MLNEDEYSDEELEILISTDFTLYELLLFRTSLRKNILDKERKLNSQRRNNRRPDLWELRETKIKQYDAVLVKLDEIIDSIDQG